MKGTVQMEPTPSKSADRPSFEEMCSQVGDFETLPTVTTRPADDATDEPYEDQTMPLDGLILAGLVTP
jgi:hypothetical protein